MIRFFAMGRCITNIDQILYVEPKKLEITIVTRGLEPEWRDYETREEVKARMRELGEWFGDNFLKLKNGTLINLNHVVVIYEIEAGTESHGYGVRYELTNGHTLRENYKTKEESVDRLYDVAGLYEAHGELDGV